MCFGRMLFNKAFKRDKKPLTMKPNSFLGKKLMGDKFGELHDLVRAHRKMLEAIEHEELSVTTADGLKLVGWFFDAGSKNTAIVVHGYKSQAWTDGVIQAYNYFKHGFNVLISDNRACGRSEGKYLTFGVHECEDIALWAKMISERIPNGNIVLHGTSLGGATVTMCSALDIPNVRTIVEDCAYLSMRWEFEHMTKSFIGFVPRLMINSAEKIAKKELGFDFETKSPINSVKEAKYPMFFVHGRADTFIPYTSAEQLYAACPTDKELLIVDGYGHGGSQVVGDKYFESIFAFVDKYCK